ncbi:Pilin/Flagellin PilA family [Methanonatronarchaeum thermophilum]|uniref:Pilin/Flagellin PilA family n=1 Tax=Methanonatronarchaeum thermophilum TaxID=1927129 RepID=A0A1Y3GDG5_9EURY|nr:type IV pilin N-terminal domain-containing protein [Methanonatronarchaeum thermophilum]OUJ19478.1 Pilin/Flagellin PilA family [Methanonatronarchaeum thermophilum]
MPPNNNGLAPVVGVILLVSITVLIAVLFFAFTPTLTGQLGETPPTTNLEVEKNDDNIIIVHNGGETLDRDKIEVKGANPENIPDKIQPGDRIQLEPEQ